NYSYIYSSEQNFLTDFNTMKSIITSATGVQPNICRFPGGIGNTVSLKHHGNTPIMPTLLSDVNNMGFTAFDWNAGGEDAEIPRPASGQQFASEIMKEVGNTKHPIILMHDLYQVSINTVPILIQELRAEGYNFSPLTPAIKPVQQRPVLSRK
ncbi:MAG TPA: hypothetical protein DEP42_01380, partial [Ruminococcaceae bacterium]|nr:hypothetical protein [Oscillospiraceae bacterium]